VGLKGEQMSKTPDPEELREMIAIADLYIPIIEEALAKVGPVLGGLIEKIDRFFCETQTASFHFYVDKGFSREEAMLLVINAKVSLQEILREQRQIKK
jgi:hypothetical protein